MEGKNRVVRETERRSGKSTVTVTMAVLTAVYAIIMIYLMFFRSRGGFDGSFAEYAEYHVKLIPFETTMHYLRRLAAGTINPKIAVTNVFGNIVMFIPLGVIIPFFMKNARRWYKTALSSATVMLAVETAQLISMRGTFDVDDIILNTLGAVIGYVVFTVGNRTAERMKQEGGCSGGKRTL